MLRWMVAGPEIARAITEFDTNCMMSSKRGSQKERHHEHTLSTQTSSARDMNTLVETMDSYGNPFDKETSDLSVLDTRVIVDSKISQSIRDMEKIGRPQHNEFTEERLIQATKSVAAPITRNDFPRSTPLVSSFKNDCALFSRFFVSCQTRDGGSGCRESVNQEVSLSYLQAEYPYMQHPSIRFGVVSFYTRRSRF